MQIRREVATDERTASVRALRQEYAWRVGKPQTPDTAGGWDGERKSMQSVSFEFTLS